MNLDLQRLSSGERIAAGSALALLVCMFFGWFSFGFETLNAWEGLDYISPILTVAIVATVGIAFMKATDRSIGDIPGGMTIFVLGCVAALLILFRLIDPVSYPGVEGAEANSSAAAGLFLALIAAAGVAAGGYLATGGTALDQLKTLLPSGSPAMPPPAPRPPAPPAPTPPPAPAATAPFPATPAPAPPVVAPPAPSPAQPAPVSKVFCEQCGAAIAPEDRFCSECGGKRPL
ncbi:MAG TPA: zinc ribbon domain-containing protein [Solirubrobacterales bacterium]|jgi:hypothetical protein|nr:zinc ribbon domain-containing protein [Solirubrobacterales bacterium]